MLNQVVLVGRLTEDPVLISTINGKKISSITVEVQRTFKNKDGIYETDFIRCILWNDLAASIVEYCHKGDLVGIKGHVQSSSFEDEDGNKTYTVDIIANKITFLSSKKDEEE